MRKINIFFFREQPSKEIRANTNIQVSFEFTSKPTIYCCIVKIGNNVVGIITNDYYCNKLKFKTTELSHFPPF